MQKNNIIHPTAIIEEGAQIGENNYIGPFCHIHKNVVLGDGNRFESHISIGAPAEHRDYFRKEPGKVEIGNNNIIREFITVTGGTTGTTKIGNNCVLQRGCYIGHDAHIENNVNLSCNVLIAGYTIICDYANLGQGCAIHQNRVVGALSMIGMNSTVVENPLPFVISFGTPSNIQRVNEIGLQRAGVADKDIELFKTWYSKIKGYVTGDLKVGHEFDRYLDDYKDKLNYFAQKK